MAKTRRGKKMHHPPTQRLKLSDYNIKDAPSPVSSITEASDGESVGNEHLSISLAVSNMAVATPEAQATLKQWADDRIQQANQIEDRVKQLGLNQEQVHEIIDKAIAAGVLEMFPMDNLDIVGVYEEWSQEPPDIFSPRGKRQLEEDKEYIEYVRENHYG
jgi:hypothetical protein